MKETRQVSKNYAQALLEIAGSDLSTKEKFLVDLNNVVYVINKTSLAKQVLKNPTLSKEIKKDILRRTFSNHINEKVLNLLFLLIDKHRTNLINEIQKEFSGLLNTEKGIVLAEVSMASEMSPQNLDALKEKLEDILKKSKKVTIESKVDTSLIGGVKVKINDLVYDGSIRGRLANLKRELQ